MKIPSFFEISGTFISILSVICMLKKNRLYWYLGMASNILWFLVFTSKSIYISAGLQISYLLFSVYGVIRWHLDEKGRQIPKLLDGFGVLISIGIFCITVVNTSFGTPFSYLEPVSAVLLIAANWLAARKHLSCWYFWMAGDAIYAVFMWNSQIYLMSMVLILFIVLSVLGLIEWKKARKQDHAREIT